MKVVFIFVREDWEEMGRVSYPQGILILGTIIKRLGHEVKVLDQRWFPKYELFEPEVRGADLVGLSFATIALPRIPDLVDVLRSFNPDAVMFAGGSATTLNCEETLNAGFDYLFIGEAEASLPKFVNAIEYSQNPLKVPGIVGRNNVGKTVSSGPPPLVNDTDIIPDYTLMKDIRTYKKVGMNRATLVDGRGCVFRCSYCQPYQNKLFPTFRTRSAKSVFLELEILRKNYDWTQPVFFLSNLFTLRGNREKTVDWFNELARLRATTNQTIPLCGHTRIDMVSKPVLKAAKSAGCYKLGFGVESGSNTFHEFFDTGKKLNKVSLAFEMCREVGIETNMNIMLGYPMETEETLKETLEMVRRVKPDSLSIYMVTPLVGTYLYDWAAEHDMFSNTYNKKAPVLSGRGEKINLPLALQNVTPELVEEYRNKIIATVQ